MSRRRGLGRGCTERRDRPDATSGSKPNPAEQASVGDHAADRRRRQAKTGLTARRGTAGHSAPFRRIGRSSSGGIARSEAPAPPSTGVSCVSGRRLNFAPPSTSFNWRNAEWRKYQSFADFYQRELENTWGSWEQLQEKFAQVARGQKTKVQVEQAVRAAAAQQRDARDRQKQRNWGGDRKSKDRHIKLYNKKGDVQDDPPPTGNSTEAVLRRLRKDRLDLHTRVMAGELSAHAAMIEAGFRKRQQRPKLTPVARALRAFYRLSAEDRALFRAEIQ